MTLIDIMQAKSVEASLNYDRQRMKFFLAEVQDIERRLGSLSGMSDIRRSIEHIVDDMEMEEQVLESMYRCLEQGIHTYTYHEENITDFAEEKAREGEAITVFKAVDFEKLIPKEIFKVLY